MAWQNVQNVALMFRKQKRLGFLLQKAKSQLQLAYTNVRAAAHISGHR
jgi:hypothetical protein